MIGSALFIVTLGTALPAVEYDCQAEKQLLMMTRKGEWTYSAQDVERSQKDTFRWTFIAKHLDDGTITVSHDPGIIDAVGVGGEYTATPIAPGQFGFATKKDQNCLFTEFACGALVEISDNSKKKASFSLVPLGSVKMEDDSREIFQMVMLGTCKKSESKQ